MTTMSRPCASSDSLRAEALKKRKARHRHTGAASEERPSEPNAAGAHRQSAQPKRPAVTPVLAGLRIMVVDDDADSLDYFAMALRAAGAVVSVASNADDALRIVQEQRPDAVLSDIAMSGHDGYWLLGEIRGLADEAVRRLPIVATTAYGREHSRERTLAAGFNDHLSKPVLPEALWRAMARAAGRPTA
jgi:CheY-like chemotaxis protein